MTNDSQVEDTRIFMTSPQSSLRSSGPVYLNIPGLRAVRSRGNGVACSTSINSLERIEKTELKPPFLVLTDEKRSTVPSYSQLHSKMSGNEHSINLQMG